MAGQAVFKNYKFLFQGLTPCFTCFMDGIIARSFCSNMLSFTVSHSQTVSTLHPISFNFWQFSKSRCSTLLNFALQNSRLLVGKEVRGQPCWCQKQPFTKIASLKRGRTISGVRGAFYVDPESKASREKKTSHSDLRRSVLVSDF